MEGACAGVMQLEKVGHKTTYGGSLDAERGLQTPASSVPSDFAYISVRYGREPNNNEHEMWLRSWGRADRRYDKTCGTHLRRGLHRMIIFSDIERGIQRLLSVSH